MRYKELVAACPAEESVSLQERFALGRRRNSQRLAVFGHGASRDVDLFCLENLDDLLVANGLLRGFARDDVFNLLFDRR